MTKDDEKVIRAWSTFEIKSIDESGDKRILEGIATTPNTDRMGDIVEPKGAQFKLPLPFLWQHQHGLPIGQVLAAKVTDAGIFIRVQIAKAGVTDFIDNAWALIKEGLVRGLSIGFRSIEKSQIGDTWSFRFTKWDLYEISSVTIPANADCSITTIKSLDEEQSRAALGATTKAITDDSTTPAGVPAKKSNTPPVSYKGTQAMATKTIQENIQDAENKRAANLSRVQELAGTAREESRAMDDAENEEYDTLVAEIKTIDKDLVRQRELLELSKDDAKPAPPASAGPDAGTAARGNGDVPQIKWNKSKLPPGRMFTRAAIAMMRAKGDSFQALENAKVYKDTPEVEQAVKAMIYAKAAVAAGTTTDSTWAAPLVVYQNLASEFIELLRPATILGKLTGVRNVPFNISIPRTTAGSTSAWVGEDDPKPVSRMSFDSITLGHNKIATIVVLSEELVQDSSPAAESLVQADMIAAVQQYSDQQFIDPTVAASGTIRPASITNGLPVHNMTGTAVANVLADAATLMAGMVNGDIPFTNMYWIMHPRTALYLSMLLSPLGTLQFPNINVNGGTFLGFPVITSTAVPIDTGDGTYIILCNASEILLAESGMMVDVSREASLQMDGAPSDSAASLISLWQKNLVGLKVERRISYRRRRDAAVAVLKAVSY